MNINFTKTINELAPALQIADLIDIDHDTILSVAKGSNGQFLADRAALTASEFLSKYFSDYTVRTTTDQVEAARKAKTVAVVKAKKAKNLSPILDEYGHYIVTLWECDNEFAASYRKTAHMSAHWHILSKTEVEYKKDGRRFSVVHHTDSRKKAVELKAELREQMEQRGLTFKGEMPV